MYDMVQMESDSTASTTSSVTSESNVIPWKTRIKRRASSTPELAAHTRKKTCNAKSTTSSPSIPLTASSLTSVQASTLSAKVCSPFWNESSREWCEKLWSCTKTACIDMESSSWSLSSKRLARSSWFTVKMKRQMTHGSLLTTSLPSPQYLWRVIMGDDLLPIGADGKKSIKIRVYPTKEQDVKLKLWIGAARWTYNRCVEAYKKKACKMSKKELRAYCVNNDALGAEEWVKKIPYDIRDEGMDDFLKALKATRAKKNLNHFDFKFRSKKDETQSIAVLKKHWGHRRGVYADLLNSHVLHGHQNIPATLDCDSRMIRTRLRHYYLCLPQPLDIWGDNQAPVEDKHSTISLDPGVRTFVTGYDADGAVCEWGEADMGRIYRLCYAVDRLQSRWSKPEVRHHQRYRMRVAARRIRLKIHNLVDELHKRLTKWLCENYRCVLLPEFETSKMVRRGKRKFGTKTARAMCTWSHYRFRQRLLSKAREYPWCRVVITEEPYTSKTCGNCGWINAQLGGSKTFNCRQCAAVFDRDYNGARNILLRHLTVSACARQ